jgi:hypothetical protein
MKQIISFFLALCILGQASVPALWVLDYQWRRAVYLKQCENKNNPDLHCDGKCYLKKQVTAGTKQDPEAPRLPGNFYSIKDLNLYCEVPQAFYIKAAVETGHIQPLPPYQRHCPEAPLASLFRPPSAG